uniref:Tryptophan--tRNA ligase, cytoplasmic n=1 Tax=Brassica campestris TaxID=3711 RepID=M4FG90_BRACM
METIEKMIEDFKKVLDDSNHTSPETLKHEMIQWLDETLSPRLKQVLEERETQSSSSSSSEQTVTPFVVSGKIDYEKVILKFGCTKIDESLIDRVERLTSRGAHVFLRRGFFYAHRDLDKILDCHERGDKFYLYTGRGPSSESLHLGHLIPFLFTKYLQEAFKVPLVIQITDDEKKIWKKLNKEKSKRLGRENVKDIIACGFDASNTFIFSSYATVGGKFYENVVEIADCVTVNKANSTFGFTGEASTAKMIFPSVQAAPSFSSSFPHKLFPDEKKNIPCLIPCAIDQDPYFRLTRDVAPRLDFIKPALIESKFFPALRASGNNGKMSASDANSAIYINDSAKDIKRKINSAVTGGRDNLEDQKKYGAKLEEDIPFQYLSFFLEDDAELEHIKKEYGEGRMTTGDVKKRLVQVVTEIVERHRMARAAVTDEIKTGNVGVLSQVSFLLVAKDWPLQVRIYASKLLQHLVKLRWDELSSSEQMDISSASFELMSEVAAANPCEECEMKSETVTLVAEMFEKEEDLEMWQELFLSLASLSSQGPLHAELALKVVKTLSEHHIDHMKELEALVLMEEKLLMQLLEKHFGDARNAEGRDKVELAKQHSDAVVACLNAINSLTEWAPVPDFAEYKIIDQCASLLSSPEFCRLACMFFTLICSRERPTDDASGAEFDSTIIHICKMMVSLGSTNLHYIFTDSNAIALYLKQMLWFFEHYKFDLHYESLFFWLGLMDYLTSDLKAPNYPHRKGSASEVFTGSASEVFNSFRHLDGGKKDLLLLIDDETASKMLDVSFQRMNKNDQVLLDPGTNLLSLEPSSFTFEEFCKYQKRLFVLIRLISSHKPIIASTKLSSRTIMLIKNISVSSAPCVQQYAAAMKSQSTALEGILRRLFRGTDEFAGGSSQVRSQLHVIFEGLLQELLNANWTEPLLISAHVDYLNAMFPFLKYLPDTVASVIDKMFALLTSLPPASKRARLYICSSLIRLAKTADKSFTPHLKGLADKMTCLQREGTLFPGEHSSLVEAFFAMTSASGGQREQQDSFLLLLEPVRQQWTQPEWQNEYLSTPSGFIQLCSNAPLMRSIVDTVAVFEKALKGCNFKKRKLNMSETIHPLASHLSWMLPPLLKLFRVINSLSSPDAYQTLPTKLKEAMKITEAELRIPQGKQSRKLTKGFLTYSSKGNTYDIRNWLKAIRESGYRVLNLSVSMGETFYTSINANEVALTFTENIWWMEFRHIKQLINSFVGCLVSSCPADMWEPLLEPLLSPLLTHCQRALDSSWTSLLREGRANVPDLIGFEGGETKLIQLERQLLIDLSRSTSDLLSKISAPELNTGLPVLKHSDQLVLGEMSLLMDFNALKSNCLVSLLLSCKNLANSVMQFSLQACTWTDGITTFNLRCLFISVIHLAVMTNNGELREFVAKDLFNAIIMSLTIDENVNNNSILVGMCSDMFVYLSQRHPAPRQVLLSLPCLTPDDLRDYEKALAETCEPKKQKMITGSMLSLALGISLEIK